MKKRFRFILLPIVIIFNTHYNNYCIILFSILILLTNVKDYITYRLFNRKIFKSFGKLTYAMYCNHGAVVLGVVFLYKMYFKNYISVGIIAIIYLIIVIIYSIITKYFVDKFIKNNHIKESEK